MSIVFNRAKIKCPKCSCRFIVHFPFGAGNRSTGPYSMEGKTYSRDYFLHLFETPYLRDVFVCPNCENYCLEKDKDSGVQAASEEGPLDIPKDREVVFQDKELPLIKVLKKLIATKGHLGYDLKKLLIIYWAGATDKRVAFWLGEKVDQGEIFTIKEEDIDFKLIEELIRMLEKKVVEDRLLKIEIFRSLGRFEEAEKLLGPDPRDKLLKKVNHQEKEMIRKKSPLPFLVTERPRMIR